MFKPNQRTTGRYEPTRGRQFTEARAPSLQDVEQHFSGEFGVGAVPILDDDTCWWGAIDIDNHGGAPGIDLPLPEVAAKIEEEGLHVIPARSKSGGIHVYAFAAAAVTAATMRAFLQDVANRLGYGASEIFPKQGHLITKDGRKSLGNWLNLPYFEIKETVRYAIRAGKRLSLEQFLDLAESQRITPAALKAATLGTHDQAPPCIQRMLAEGVAEGQRNLALYNTVIYLRKVDAGTARDQAGFFNESMFNRPLPRAELKRTVDSAINPAYNYKCGEDPIKSLCDRPTCLKRKFGVGEGGGEEFPTFTDLTRTNSNPPLWGFTVGGDKKLISMNTVTIYNYELVCLAAVEQHSMALPRGVSKQSWHDILKGMLKDVRIIDTPIETSEHGQALSFLQDYLDRANWDDLPNGHDDVERYKTPIKRGLPAILPYNGELYLHFIGQYFLDALRRSRIDTRHTDHIWAEIRNRFQADQRNIRINGRQTRVWVIPVNAVRPPETPEQPKFESEL